MDSLDATTPQLKVIDLLFTAYRTRDTNNVARFLSKNFTYRALPETADLPDQTKEQHVEFFGPIFPRLAKLEYVSREAIEAPGKVVLQWTAMCTPPGGTTFEYDSLTIFSFVKEDGELKVLEFKDFADTEKRSNFYKTTSAEGQIA